MNDTCNICSRTMSSSQYNNALDQLSLSIIIGIIRGVEWGVRKHSFRGGDIDNIQNYIQ